MSARGFMRAGIALVALVGLSGCASVFGGNVRGDFQCRAPGGTCAPSARIDDQAIAALVTPEEVSATPAASPQRRSARIVGAETPARSQEKVLRIVFPSFIDGQGRLHEASAIHAVVEQGDWQLQAATAQQGHGFAEATGQRAVAEAPAAVVSEAPSEAAVAAARARAPTSVDAIRQDVEARIAKRQSVPVSDPAAGALPAEPVTVPDATGKTGAVPIIRAEPFSPPQEERE